MGGFTDGHPQKDGFSMNLECGHPNTRVGEMCQLCGKFLDELKILRTPQMMTVPRDVKEGEHMFQFQVVERGTGRETLVRRTYPMEKYSDIDLANLADWAEAEDRASQDAEKKKAMGALRQGADWLLRWRAKERQKQLEGGQQ